MITVNGRKIRELRESANLSQQELAERVGSSQVKVAKTERGIQQPSVALLKRIADYFDVTMDELVTKSA